MSGHTPGPWGRNIPPISKYPVIYAGRNTHVAQVLTKATSEAEAEANADLIAAAPELLAACKAFESNYPMGINPGADEAVRAAVAAIAKAEGGQ